LSAIAPEWWMLSATVRFAEGATEDAAAIVESVFRSRFPEHPDLEQMIGDCRRIVQCLSHWQGLELLASARRPRVAPLGTGLRKIFVCGNGWSGSGALYDALKDYDGVVGMPYVPIDHHINACTGDETMFVQGSAGFGRIWRKARDERRLSSTDLWELFRCHVVGSGGVGHTEHKGANTAVNLLGRFGARYTAAFLGFYESIVAFPAGIGLHQFHSILLEATELLSSIVTGAQDGQYAVFNNAMFGPNIDMVEIYSNFRLAVVVRDPLDQYA